MKSFARNMGGILVACWSGNHSPQGHRGRTEGSGRCCLFVIALLLASFAYSIKAATLPIGFAEAQVAAGITNPTAMAFAPDGRLFVCQQGASFASSGMALCWRRRF